MELFSSVARNNPRFAKQVVIVTGGSSGIGKTTCEEFASEGAKVVNFDIDENNGEKSIKEIRKTYDSDSIFFKGDVSSEDDIKRLLQEIDKKYGRLDVIVNNAAQFFLKGFEATKEELQRSLEVGVIGPALVTKYSIDLLKKAQGSVVNIGSVHSFVAYPDYFAYSVAKAGVVQLTRNMAMDLAKYGIRVNSVCPGPILTEAIQAYADFLGVKIEEIIKELSDKTFFKRMGTTSEVAKAIMFLASKEASYITGSFLMVDGGWTAM